MTVHLWVTWYAPTTYRQTAKRSSREVLLVLI